MDSDLLDIASHHKDSLTAVTAARSRQNEEHAEERSAVAAPARPLATHAHAFATLPGASRLGGLMQSRVISQHLGVRNSGTTGLGYASFMVPPESTRGAAVACSTNLDNIPLGGFVPHLQPTAAAGDSTAIGKVEQVPRA